MSVGNRFVWRFLLTGLSLFCASGTLSASEIFVPPGLLPGDMYHLTFVTQSGRDASSFNIADYDAFVQSEAVRVGALTASYGLTWKAIASTPSVAARDHAFVSAPVFLLDGNQIAVDLNDLWDASIGGPLSIDQFGASVGTGSSEVWTGTLPSGFGGGTVELGTTDPIRGDSTATGLTWVANGSASNNLSLRFYALSEKVTVPAAVPEPSSTVVLMSLGLVGLCLSRRRITKGI